MAIHGPCDNKLVLYSLSPAGARLTYLAQVPRARGLALGYTLIARWRGLELTGVG